MFHMARAFVWAPGVAQQHGLRRLYWNEDGQHTTTNPLRPGVEAGSYPCAWQVILPYGAREGGDPAKAPKTPKTPGKIRKRGRFTVRPSPPLAPHPPPGNLLLTLAG